MSMKDSNNLRRPDSRFGPDYTVDHPEGGKIWIRHPEPIEMDFIHKLIVSEISPDAGTVEAMRRVLARNPDSFWLIEHVRDPGVIPQAIGFYAFLPLTAEGLVALERNTLDRRNPPTELVAAYGTIPAALYLWAVVARKLAKRVNPLIHLGLGESYATVPTYARAATEGGRKAANERGFTGVSDGSAEIGTLVRLPSVAEEMAARAQKPKGPRLEVIVASNAEHLNMIAFLRGATFGAEQNCPYREEFDDNDYCALHLLGFVNDEPAAVLRVRFFAGFAKLERLAVLPRFRSSAIKNEIMNRAIEICRRKGYRKLYGQSQERLVDFYGRFGFRPVNRNRELVFSDHAYVEIESELAPHEDAITTASNPYVIIRPEGRWDMEGILEKSAIRPVTNPH